MTSKRIAALALLMAAGLGGCADEPYERPIEQPEDYFGEELREGPVGDEVRE